MAVSRQMVRAGVESCFFKTRYIHCQAQRRSQKQILRKWQKYKSCWMIIVFLFGINFLKVVIFLSSTPGEGEDLFWRSTLQT